MQVTDPSESCAGKYLRQNFPGKYDASVHVPIIPSLRIFFVYSFADVPANTFELMSRSC